MRAEHKGVGVGLERVVSWPLVAALWVAPAWAQTPAKSEAVTNLAESAQAQHQLDPSLDTEEDEAPGGLLSEPAPALGENPLIPKFNRADFASYFSEGTLAQAKMAFDSGRYRKALKLLESQEASIPVRYLRAMSALRLGLSAQAAPELSSLAEDHLPLRDYYLFEAGRTYERLRQWDEAARHYAAVPSYARRYAEARFNLAKLHEKKGRWTEAVEALTPLVQAEASAKNGAVQAEAWLKIAQLARRQADYTGEHRAMLALWALHPFSRQTARVRARLEELPLPPKWKVAKAETLLSQHLNREALELLDKVLPKLEALPDPVACRAHFAYGSALRKERHHTRAIRSLQPVVEQCQDATLRARAMYVMGYSQSVVDPDGSIATYLRLATELPEHPYADDALFYAARKSFERGNTAAAMDYSGRLLSRYPEGSFAAEALFQRFWVHRSEQKYEEALQDLMRIETLHGPRSTHEAVKRARYWRARTLSALGREEEGLALMERVAFEGAASWYGLLARSRLAHHAPERAKLVMEKLRAPAELPEVWPLEPGNLRQDPRFVTGLELMRLGHSSAAAELLAVDRKGRGEDSLRLLFHLLRDTGHERAARVVAATMLREGLAGASQAESRLFYEAAYPQPFRTLVVRHSRAARVNPDLMQALIREESAFNPSARSPTGALGLAQLMPQTAFAVARELKVNLTTTSLLLEPQHNIQLGSAYLGSLHKRFDGNPAYAVASYNAGPGAVDRWRARFPDSELDEWVEQIPIEETRHYVKRVLGSASAYQFISNERGSLTTLAFGTRGSNNTGSR